MFFISLVTYHTNYSSNMYTCGFFTSTVDYLVMNNHVLTIQFQTSR